MLLFYEVGDQLMLDRYARRMLCDWSTKANVIIRRSINVARNAERKAPTLKKCPSGIWRIGSRSHLNITSSYHSFSPTPPAQGSPALPHAHSPPQSPATILASISSTTEPSFVIDNLTSAQVSRASAAAIRISFARGDLWDGFHLWHSLRWSMHYYHKPGPSSVSRPPFHSPIAAFEPIDFGQPVSTKLSGHCLLHGLLRAGKTKTAAMLAEQMMAYGEELHPLSFKTLLRQLHPSTTPDSPRTVYDRLRGLALRKKVPVGPRILELQNVMPADPPTRFAVRLLSSARKHRWQRTTAMYGSVVHACLIQGEILVASLLLALLLKDYQLRNACSRVAAEADRAGAPDTIAYVHSKIPDAPFRGFKLLPYRNSRFLFQSVTKFLEKHCAQVDDPLFPEASQALANLASALDARKIPYANMATLIKVLYSYPPCQRTIWITLPSGERQPRDAYRYFHDVLLNLLCSLPDQRSLDLDTIPRPALDLESYNALLNYAMRHRHSIALAGRVLHHMTVSRQPQLSPNITTFNILLRGSTLMRRNDIAESILRVVRSRLPGKESGTFLHHFSPRTSQGWNSRVGSYPTSLEFDPHCHRFRGLLEDIRQYELRIPQPKGHLKPDNTLLTSYMAHLVATGRPRAVAAVITRVIPEFAPLKKDATSEELTARWQTSVVRGVALGPHFFSVALNALRKAGLRNLAERLWTLARAAETESLLSSDTAPWCLGVHAYTAMLQLYADETRWWPVSNTATRVGQPGRPYHLRDSRRAMLGMRMGMQVFRALPLAADRVRQAAVRECKEGREWKYTPAPPNADARFYNAALGLVSRRPGMCRRGSRPSPRWRWNHTLLGKAHRRFVQTGQKPRGWTPELEEIAKSLRKSGYTLPIGFRVRLLGRDEQLPSQVKIDLGVRPYSFGRGVWARFAPHRIPTVKRKGLPLRGRWRHSKWSSIECDGTPEGTVTGVI